MPIDIARAVMELPVLRLLSRPIYRRVFKQPHKRGGNLYYGIYPDFGTAHRAARAFSSATLPATYDVQAAGRMYRTQLRQLRSCDYSSMFWIDQALSTGARRIFDLGGHIGLAYYGFRKHLDFPPDLDWCVHDVPTVMATGRDWAEGHDPDRKLRFADTIDQADGCDLLFSSGALQYLDYSLPELLRRLRQPPRHVLFNLTPMQHEHGYVTLQNIGIAVCPYRVMSIAQLVEDMAALGYTVHDRWELPERHLRVPFEPRSIVDCYYGFYFQRRQDGDNRPDSP